MINVILPFLLKATLLYLVISLVVRVFKELSAGKQEQGNDKDNSRRFTPKSRDEVEDASFEEIK